MAVVNMVDACTNCISLETVNRLDKGEANGFSIYQTGHGWFISGASSEFTTDWPDDFHKLVLYAEQNNCGFINLDSDANEIDELEKFDW